jgi:hypothetical protein
MKIKASVMITSQGRWHLGAASLLVISRDIQGGLKDLRGDASNTEAAVAIDSTPS